MNPWNAWRGAVAFLTRVPVGSRAMGPVDLSWSPALFPGVGAALGAITWLVFRFTSPLGDTVAATFATTFSVLATGAFHEDGLADSADGLLGATSRERAMEIMRDSRIGTYGAAALILVLLLRIGLLAQIGTGDWLPLVLSHSLGRLGPVWLMSLLPHADPARAKHGDFLNTGRSRAWMATALTLALCAVTAGLDWARLLVIGFGWLAVTLVTLYMGRLAQRRLGGINGDLLGATEQIGEIAVLTVFAAQLGRYA